MQYDTNNRYLGFHVSIDGGSNWITSGYEYNILQMTAGPTKRTGTANWGYLHYNTVGNGTNEFVSGELLILNNQDDGLLKRALVRSSYAISGGNDYEDVGGVIIPTTSPINAVRIGDVWLGSTNFSRGHIAHRRF